MKIAFIISILLLSGCKQYTLIECSPGGMQCYDSGFSNSFTTEAECLLFANKINKVQPDIQRLCVERSVGR